MAPRVKRTAWLGLLALLGASVLGPAAADSAPPAKKPPFPPGLYVGKTSQGSPVRLRLVIGGPCGGGPCLFASNRREAIRIAVPCPDGSEVKTALPVPPSGVANNGVVHDFEQVFEAAFTAEIPAVFSVSTRGIVRGEMPTTVTRKDGSECTAKVTLVARLSSTHLQEPEKLMEVEGI
jgi:hypothetical protein